MSRLYAYAPDPGDPRLSDGPPAYPVDRPASFDPDIALTGIRAMVEEYNRTAEPGDPSDRAAGFVVLLFDSLDRHLSGGGRPPEAWLEGPDA